MLRSSAILTLAFTALACGDPPVPEAPDAFTAYCDPQPVGPHWFEENQRIEIHLSCATGLELPGDRFEFDDLPEGASYDPDSATLVWVPGLDQAAVYHIGLTAVHDDGPNEIRVLTIGVADSWNAPGNVPVVDPVRYTHEFGLPVLFLEPGPESEEYAPATIYYGGRRFDIEAKLRGASSLSYPKRNYTLRFGGGDEFDEPGHDFLDRKRVVLTSTFDDNSYIRQRLAFDLWNLLEPRMQVQAFSAVVYLDGEYFGLYTVSDFINDDLMDLRGLDRDGNLYKAINHDANFRLTNYQGNPKNTLHDGYEKTEGTPEQGQPDAFADLEELVSFVATSTDNDFGAGIGDRLEMRDYVSWWLLVSFITAADSAGKNSYHYRDPADAEGRWYVAPWDFNASFGQSWTTRRVSAAEVELYEYRNNLFGRLLADPVHGPAMSGRYRQELDEGVFTLESVLGIIDDYIAEIDRSATRDWAKWENAYRAFGRWNDRGDFTSYREEVDYVRTWIGDHWTQMSLQF